MIHVQIRNPEFRIYSEIQISHSPYTLNHPLDLANPLGPSHIGITMGDPTGIGPEIIVKALSMEEPFQVCRPIVFGDREVLSRAIQMQNLSTTLEIIEKIPEDGYLPRENISLSLKPIRSRLLFVSDNRTERVERRW